MRKNFLIFCLIVLLLVLTVGGCTGIQKTSQEPLHAETGGGITIWKIPILGISGWGTKSSVSSVIVHQYNYQAKPQALAPGTPPSSPNVDSPPVDYQTIYGSAWDDPSLVIFKNDSYRKVRIEIDSQQPIVLAPYGATANLHFGVGEHQTRVVIEKSTQAHGTLEVVRFFSIHISPEGRSQIFHIYDY